MKSITLNTVLLTIGLITLSSCDRIKTSEKQASKVSQKIAGENKMVKDSVFFNCEAFSPTMKSFIKELEIDNTVRELPSKGGMSFFNYEDSINYEVRERVSYEAAQLRAVHVKTKDKKRLLSFALYEICLPNEKAAAQDFEKIEKILSRKDPVLKGDPSFAVLNKEKIIYFQSVGKQAEAYTIAQKPKLQAIIEKQNQ